MSKYRDELARDILIASLNSGDLKVEADPQAIASVMYGIADAMIDKAKSCDAKEE